MASGPNPKFVKVGVKSKGCSGLVYNLEMVEEKAPLDEVVTQDGMDMHAFWT